MEQVQIDPGSAELDLGTLLQRLAVELQESATHLTALQWSISILLEKVHHPDLAEEIHMLQDIDRLQQTLADVAAVIDVTAALPAPVAIPRDPVCAAIRLESLRSRLNLAGVGGDRIGVGDEVDITWL